MARTEVSYNPNVSVYYQADSLTFPSNPIEGDELFVTSTGDNTGDVVEHWIFDGTNWFNVGAGGNCSFIQDDFIATVGQTSFVLTGIPNDIDAVFMFINQQSVQGTLDFNLSTSTITYTGSYTIAAGDYVWFKYLDCSISGGGTGGGITSVTGNIVDNTDPLNPVITQVAPDWNATTGLGVITNKPTIPLSICALDTITQAQADTLGLEHLKVVVCGTGNTDIDGKTVILDKVAGLLNQITAPAMGGSGTSTVSNITTTGADLVGTYTGDGGSTIIGTGFVIYPSGNASTIIGGVNVLQFIDSSLSSTINAMATGLAPATNYCMKPYAINAIGTSYGVEVCFTTSQATFIAGRQFGLGVSKVDFDTATISSTLYSGNDIIGLGLNGNIGYASYTNTVAKFNTTTMTHIASYTGTFNPNDLKYYDGYIYHCSDSTNVLQKIDASTMTLTSSLSMGGGSAVINCIKDGLFLYVGSKGNARLTKIDLSTFTVVSYIDLVAGINNTVIGLSVYGGFLYANIGETSQLYKVDLSTFTTVGSPLSLPTYTFYNKVVGGFLYVTSLSSGVVRKIDLSTFTVVSTLSLGTNPAGLTYDNGNYLYVSLLGSPAGGNITKIDLSTFTIVSTIGITGTRNIFIS